MWALIVIVLMLSWGELVVALSPRQNYGGPEGQISGFVIGVNGYPVDWALVNATDGQHAFTAFSGMSGFYLMRVPSGTYNISVYAPGFWAYATGVNVTEDSTVEVDFHLQPSTVPVPEIQPGLVPVVLALTIAAALAVSRRTSKRKSSEGLDAP